MSVREISKKTGTDCKADSFQSTWAYHSQHLEYSMSTGCHSLRLGVNRMAEHVKFALFVNMKLTLNFLFWRMSYGWCIVYKLLRLLKLLIFLQLNFNPSRVFFFLLFSWNSKIVYSFHHLFKYHNYFTIYKANHLSLIRKLWSFKTKLVSHELRLIKSNNYC